MTEPKLEEQTTEKASRFRFRLPALLGGKARSQAVVASKASPLAERAADRPAAGMALPTRQAKTRPSLYWLTLIGGVLLPALASTIYLIFWASDQYQAEARFAVRKAQTEQSSSDKASSATSALSGAMSGSGLADQEAHIVANYLRSRAAVEDIQKDVNIIEIFQRPEADFWARLKKDPSKEELVDYWNSMVSTYVDGPSGVVTVSARAFRPEDAKLLVEAFVATSERLVNKLSERARRDAMAKSEAEVRRTEAMVRQALFDLRQYRDQEGFITPLMEATATSKLLAEAMSERIKIQSDFFVASRALSPDAPSLQALKSRLDSLDQEIEKLKSQLTNRSGDSRSVSASIVKFEELELRRLFAEKMYTLSQDALERARLRAEQQAVYVSVFVPPHLPQEARFPERISTSLIVAIGLLLLWSVGALTAAAVDDHRI